MPSLRERLIAARARIEDPEHWIKGNFAKTAQGRVTFPADQKATCFCLVGTLRADDTEHDAADHVKIVSEVVQERFIGRFNSIPAFNDHKDTTHAGVLRVLDIAISRC